MTRPGQALARIPGVFFPAPVLFFSAQDLEPLPWPQARSAPCFSWPRRPCSSSPGRSISPLARSHSFFSLWSASSRVVPWRSIFFPARELCVSQLCSSRVRCSSPLPRLPPCSLREPRPSDQSQPSSLQLQPGSIHGLAVLLVGARRGRRRSVAPSPPAPISLVKLPWRATSSSRPYLAGSPSRAAFLHLPVCRGARIAPRLLCLLGARLLWRLAAASLCAPLFFYLFPKFLVMACSPCSPGRAPCALLAHGVCRAPFLLGRAPTESPMAAPWDLPESASLGARCFFSMARLPCSA